MNQKIVVAAGAVFLAGIVYHFIKMIQFHFRLRNMERRHREEIVRLADEKAISIKTFTDAQSISVRANDQLAEENGRLHEKILNQQATIIALQNEPSKQEKIELQILRETVEKMETAVPGFSVAWLAAYHETRERIEKETTSGLKALFLKCFSPHSKTAPALSGAEKEK